MILSLILTVILIGFLYWLTTLFPIPSPFDRIVRVLFIAWAILALLEVIFGIHLLGGSVLFPFTR